MAAHFLSTRADAADDEPRTILITCTATFALATVFFALRLLSKVWVVKKTGLDDLAMGVAWVFAGVLSVIAAWGSTYGIGLANSDIPAAWIKNLHISIYVMEITYPIAVMAAKVSILVLYLRLSTAYFWLRRSSYFLLFVTILVGVATTLAGIFQCDPIRAALDAPGIPGDSGAKCADVFIIHLCLAPVNFVIDVTVVLLPLPILTSMRMERRQKRILFVTFAGGVFVSVVSLVRLVFLQHAVLKREQDTDGVDDPEMSTWTFYASLAFLWSVIEVNVGIICACSLVLKPLVQRISPGLIYDSRTPLSGATMSAMSRNSAHSEVGASDDAVPTFPDVASNYRLPQSRTVSISMSPMTPNRTPTLDGFRRRSTMTDTGLRVDIGDFLAMEQKEDHTFPPRLDEDKAPAVAFLEDVDQPLEEFDSFVRIALKEPLTTVSAKEGWRQVGCMSLLFLAIGFAYGMLSALNTVLESLASFTSNRQLGVSAGYFGAYFIAPPLGYFILKGRYGFKGTLLVGLWIAAMGCLAYWPSGVLQSFAGYWVATLIAGIGLSNVLLAGNLLVALAGPDHLAEVRLNFVQGVEAIASICASVIGNVVFDQTGTTRLSLIDTEWYYMAFAIVLILMCVALFYFRLGEVTPGDLEEHSLRHFDRSRAEPDQTTFGIRTKKVVAVGGILCFFVYYGCQEALSEFRKILIVYHDSTATQQHLIKHFEEFRTVFCVSRFLAAGAGYLGIPGRQILLVSFFGSLVCLVIATLPAGLIFHEINIAFIVLYGFFEGPISPTIFAMALRGMGKDVRLVALGMTMSVAGGAAFPALVWVQMKHERDVATALRPISCLFAIGCVSMLVATLTPSIRNWVDPTLPPDHRREAVAAICGLFGRRGWSGRSNRRGSDSSGGTVAPMVWPGLGAKTKGQGPGASSLGSIKHPEATGVTVA